MRCCLFPGGRSGGGEEVRRRRQDIGIGKVSSTTREEDDKNDKSREGPDTPTSQL